MTKNQFLSITSGDRVVVNRMGTRRIGMEGRVVLKQPWSGKVEVLLDGEEDICLLGYQCLDLMIQ